MSHWKYEQEREDGDNFEQDQEAAFDARKWMRGVADRSQSPLIRDMMGDLRQLEMAAGPFFLGLDYDEDLDDVSEIGPF